MKKFFLGIFIGFIVGWFIVTDLHGNIARHDPLFGILCRAHNLDAILLNAWGEDRKWVCTDLSDAIPEEELFNSMFENIRGASTN